MMTPELRQAIAILQLSAVELSDVIAEEILENPVLEIVEKDVDGSEPLEHSEQVEASREQDQLDDYFNWADYFNNGMEKKGDYVVADEKKPFELFVKNNISLHEHL